MKRRKEQKSYIKLLIVLLVIVVGYALVSTTLKINGNLLIRNNTWNIHWVSNSVNVTSGSATATTPANVVDASNVEFAVNLNKPGEYYEFTVDAKNDGTVAGLLEIAEIKAYEQDGETEIADEDIPGYITKEISRANGKSLENFVLGKGQKEKFKVRIEYTMDIDEDELDNDFTCIFKFTAKFKQTRASETYGATLVLNTDSSQKNLIGTAYLDPTDYGVECDASSNLADMPIYPATSWPEIDLDVAEGYQKDYYHSATNYATSNDGCMKFYVYKDTGDSYKMILDHNTTASAAAFPVYSYVNDDGTGYLDSQNGNVTLPHCLSTANSEEEFADCRFIINKILKRDTKDWLGNPNLITAEELSEITEKTIDTSSNIINRGIDVGSNFPWLFDNLNDKTTISKATGEWKCIGKEKSCFTGGYFTQRTSVICSEGTYDNVDEDDEYYPGATYEHNCKMYAWYVGNSSDSYGDPNKIGIIDDYWGMTTSRVGVRPVITVPKKVFGQS